MKTVLIVEDDDDDLFLLKMACKRTGIPHNLDVTRDGEEAIKYLRSRLENSNRLPDLVFLDVKLPKADGFQVLKRIRGPLNLKSLPVVKLSLLGSPSTVNRAYKLGVTSCLRKTSNLAEFGQAVRVILRYWLELNIPAGDGA